MVRTLGGLNGATKAIGTFGGYASLGRYRTNVPKLIAVRIFGIFRLLVCKANQSHEDFEQSAQAYVWSVSDPSPNPIFAGLLVSEEMDPFQGVRTMNPYGRHGNYHLTGESCATRRGPWHANA